MFSITLYPLLFMLPHSTRPLCFPRQFHFDFHIIYAHAILYIYIQSRSYVLKKTYIRFCETDLACLM